METNATFWDIVHAEIAILGLVAVPSNFNSFCLETFHKRKNAGKTGHNDSNLAQSQILFYRLNQHMVPDYPDMNKTALFFSGLSQQTFKMSENIAIITNKLEQCRILFHMHQQHHGNVKISSNFQVFHIIMYIHYV